MSSFRFVVFGLVCFSSSSLVGDFGVIFSDVDPKNFPGCEYCLTNFAIDFSFDAVLEIGVMSSSVVASAMLKGSLITVN